MSTATTTPTVQRAPRKCSQCRQEGCNKGKATCPVNVARTGPVAVPVVIPVVVPVRRRLCAGCRREGCTSNTMTCPVKKELIRHYERAIQMQRQTEPHNPSQYENIFNHIEDPVYRKRLSARLHYKIREIYDHQYFIFIMRAMQARDYQESNQQRSKVKLTVLPEYKMCSEECGICYDKTSNVTLNCNHKVCVDCFKGHVTATEAKFNASLKCPFCRCVTETVQATDANIHDKLVKL